MYSRGTFRVGLPWGTEVPLCALFHFSYSEEWKRRKVAVVGGCLHCRQLFAQIRVALVLPQMPRHALCYCRGGCGSRVQGTVGAISSVCRLPAQVTLFAYSDLLLFTKEDEPGRCNVLRNPLYLQSVKLQEGERCPSGNRLQVAGSALAFHSRLCPELSRDMFILRSKCVGRTLSSHRPVPVS